MLHYEDMPILTDILGETIPIRLFLGGFDLTPTFREVNKRFSTRYYLSLVLIDEGASPNASKPGASADRRPPSLVLSKWWIC